MKCFKCHKQGKYTLSYINRAYCKTHFVQLIEARIRKDLRKRNFDIKQEYRLADENSKEGRIAKHFLDNIFKGRLQYSNSGTILRPTNLDREITQDMQAYLENKPFNNHKSIRILDSVLDEELMHLCDILDITRKKEKRLSLVEDVDNKHRIKFSLKKSFDIIRCNC